MSNLSPTLSSLKGKARFISNRLSWRVWSLPIPFQWNKTRCKAASTTLTRDNIHAGNTNSVPPLPSLKKQTTQRLATPSPELNDNQSGAACLSPAPAGRQTLGAGQLVSSIPEPGQPAPRLVRVPPQPGPTRRIAAEDCRGAPSAASRTQRCPAPHRRPHLRRLPGTQREGEELGGPKLLTGKARLSGSRIGSRSRSPAPAPLSLAR